MKRILTFLCLLMLSASVNAQIKGASLQASGLTCSMCSKAVLNALQKLAFVTKVDANIEKQEYSLEFKSGASFEFDDLAKAVEDAGFSVATLKVSAEVDKLAVAKDQHLTVGGYTFHFLNAEGQEIAGPVDITLVDKKFTTLKNHRKYSSRSKMSCVATGRMETCCSKTSAKPQRIYHVII